MPASGRPRVWAGVETRAGEGAAVSYGDAGSNKSGVLLDMNAVSAGLSGFDSFGGINIHDWASWIALLPVSADTSAPPQTNDLTDPDKPTGFTAEPRWNGVVLSWQYPTNRDLAGVIIRRDMNRAPRSAYEGDLIYNGLQTTVTDITATEGRKYYYSAFAYDIFENKSDAATAETAYGDIDEVTYVRNRINILCSANDYVYFDSLAEQPDRLEVTVFDVNGHIVIELEDTNGDGVIKWDGCGEDSKPVPSGAYVYTADDGEKVTEAFILEWCE